MNFRKAGRLKSGDKLLLRKRDRVRDSNLIVYLDTSTYVEPWKCGCQLYTFTFVNDKGEQVYPRYWFECLNWKNDSQSNHAWTNYDIKEKL